MERIKKVKGMLETNSIKMDCFAYNGIKKDCSALNRSYCRTHECVFYKTKDDYDQEIELVKKRLEKINFQGNMGFYEKSE